MNNLDQELDSILEELHNSWIEDDYEFDDPCGVHAKQAIQALITTQKQELLNEILAELPKIQLEGLHGADGKSGITEVEAIDVLSRKDYRQQVKSIITTKRGEI